MTKWDESRAETDLYRVLAADGSLRTSSPGLSDETVLQFYRTFVRTRAFENKALKLQRRGEISITTRSYGEEAIALGSAAALRPGDWCFPTYRQTAAFLYWDVPMERSMASLMGAEPETIDEYLPIQEAPAVRFTPVYAPLAVNVTNAVGSAMADAFTDRDVVSLSYVGDGSTSEGDFHEALNFAGVFEAPAVVICQNNQWANSVPAEQQTAAESFAVKAEAHGVPHERVDGNDVFAVHEKTREAVERARAGDGPTFVECVSYRMGEHNTADDPTVYRTDTEREYWAERDPVDRLEAYLRNEGLIDDEIVEAIEKDAVRNVERAVDRAREIPPSRPQRMFDNHLHGESWNERHQHAQLRAELEDRNPFTDVIGGDIESSGRTRTRPMGDPSAPNDAESTREMNVVSAVTEALRQEMHRDDSVRVLGYDVGPIGGVYRATEGLLEEFGSERVVDTPLSENAILGTAVGMGIRGERVVPEIQFMGFLYPAFGQFMYTLAKMYERSGGKLEVPITVRIPYGGGVKASEYHSESTETFLVHTPGVRVVCPSTPRDTKGLLAASVRSPDPVIFLEPKQMYRGVRQPVKEEPYALPLDRARIVEKGADVTLVTWGAMRPCAETAAADVDADVEILDLRTLSPLDTETILDSVEKTGRCVILHEARRTLGLGAEISALVNEHALGYLRAPVKRVTSYDVHVPGHQVEDAYLPDAERTRHALEAVMSYEF